jgi:hypothetical protein
MPYHTIPYHTTPYHTIPYHAIPYHTIPYTILIPSDAPLLPIEVAKIWLLTFGSDNDLHQWIIDNLAFAKLSDKGAIGSVVYVAWHAAEPHHRMFLILCFMRQAIENEALCSEPSQQNMLLMMFSVR